MANQQQIMKHGLILLDKPAGLTSRQCVSRIQKLLNRVKAGHAGTLDPFATGLLPICFGRATKLVERLRKGRKTYEAELLLGVETDTQDCTGKVIQRKTVPVNLQIEVIKAIASNMIGKQLQIPPMFSAKKLNGKRLYELARQNIVVERKPKQIEIYGFDIIGFDSSVVRFRVDCSEGTYVRTLGVDLAKSLNLVGTLIALRRLHVGTFDIKDSVKLEQLENAENGIEDWLLGADSITADLGVLTIKRKSEDRFRNGMTMTNEDFITCPAAPDIDTEFNVYTEDKLFLGLGVISGYLIDNKCTLKTRRLIDIQ
ncbi:tRNA pseudouridine(55) synthase TruB [bacterium]|nr:tRNA pseudouridine(55) synthase TruB [bacterium]